MGWQTWLNSNAMAALATPNSFGLRVIQRLMVFVYINALDAIALELRI
jgi:hypothetical protein